MNIDLFPPVKTRSNGGDDIAFPIVQLELDNNPNLRSDYSLRATVQWGVDPPDSGNELVDLTLAGTFAQDLRTVAAERARELWLTGDRLTTSRRLRLDPTVNIDLFPPVKTRSNGGDDIAFPIVQLELDNNPSSGDACPAGQTIGSWR